MSPFRVRFDVLMVCLLCLWSGPVWTCDWDQSVDHNQGLDPTSLTSGARHLSRHQDVSDPEACRALCCEAPSCDLALLGFPADRRAECLLVGCWSRGRDMCRLQRSQQFQVAGKKAERSAGAQLDDGRLRVVPMMAIPAGGPLTNRRPDTVRCRLPVKVGSCRAAFPRFYYDVTNQTCRNFTYGGCEANTNNFVTQEECKAACGGVTGPVLPDGSTPPPSDHPAKAPRMAPPLTTGAVESELTATESAAAQEKEMTAEEYSELCEAEPQPGPCRAAFKRWYYDSKTGSCQTFIYGGCSANRNNYESEEICMNTCTVTVLPSSKKVSADSEDYGSYREVCLAAPESGPCRAAFSMFYYDQDSGTCQTFIYGGCRGNLNRHSSMEDCLARCSGEGSFDGRGEARSRWTAALFLLVTLTTISALLIAAFIIVTLRRRGLSHRPSSVSDKEELLPDPEEQASLESVPNVDRA
ncbi:kunitz-type protease inhibitor 2 [Aulostomus maculatus]